MAAGVVHVPWYATLFRGDKFEAALGEIAPVALRYGATDYAVYRSRDDAYKFLQMSTFADHDAWTSYWYGPEFNHFRAVHSGWYQVPIVYAWHDLVYTGEIAPEPANAEVV
jgi:quinol monooxygenase YgiN